MLGKKKHQTPVRLVKGVFVPSTKSFFQESAGQAESRRVAPVVIPTLAPTLDKSPSSLVSVQSTVLLIGTGSQTEQ